MKNILFILIVVFLFSCKEDKAKITQQKKFLTPQEMLLGNWAAIQDTLKKNSFFYHRYEDNRGFEFLPDGICDYKSGYIDAERFRNDPIDRNERIMYSLGTKTNYSFTKDSLKIFNLSDKKWDRFKIKKLSADTLIRSRDTAWAIFVKKNYETDNVPDFDAVIVSASPCFGPCPMVSIMISKDGVVHYTGEFHVSKKGSYTSKIAIADFKQIALRFKQADYMNLKNDYSLSVTDSRTVCVSFIKNGKIVKSVSDYASCSPNEFVWAYLPLITLEQKLNLIPRVVPEYIKTEFMIASFSRGNAQLSLSDSETYYLLHLLRKGRQGPYLFKEGYKLKLKNELVNEITSDGRYYKFYFKDKTTKTMDIGYNFLAENKLVHKFEKRNE